MCERNINRFPLTHPQPGTWPTTQACALTGNRTGSLSVCRMTPTQLSHTSQGYFLLFFNKIFWAPGVSHWNDLTFYLIPAFSCIHVLLIIPKEIFIAEYFNLWVNILKSKDWKNYFKQPLYVHGFGTFWLKRNILLAQELKCASHEVNLGWLLRSTTNRAST